MMARSMAAGRKGGGCADVEMVSRSATRRARWGSGSPARRSGYFSWIGVSFFIVLLLEGVEDAGELLVDCRFTLADGGRDLSSGEPSREAQGYEVALVGVEVGEESAQVGERLGE